ncbi:MAG: HEAT repeat domain-containing protein [Methylococcaceae bacterium]|nr:HEAT repeat domain-containing protein [Methylococcaceae bacterium]MCI0733975.1 HEAT repeat domain-containing protein [Methylococcaceae bacterium]
MTATTALLLAEFFVDERNDRSAAANRSEEQPVKSIHPSMDLASITERAAAPLPLTPAQMEEDARIDAEQAALARRWIENPDSRTRLDGAEQLGAYPTPEAEPLLARALATDLDPAVRIAAAASLGRFEEVGDQTVAVLLEAVEHEDEDVQMSALTTLESLLEGEEAGSPRCKRVVATLQEMARSPKLSTETKQALLDFVNAQAYEGQ